MNIEQLRFPEVITADKEFCYGQKSNMFVQIYYGCSQADLQTATINY